MKKAMMFLAMMAAGLAVSAPVKSNVAGNEVGRNGTPLPYDAEVEYIKCSGYQWINTGVYASENIRVEARFLLERNANTTIFGGGVTLVTLPSGAQTYDGFSFCSYSNTKIQYLFGDANWKYANASIIGRKFDVEFSKQALKIDGDTIVTPTYSSFRNQTVPIGLFRRPGDSFYMIAGSCYKMRIYDRGILVRDFIPVRFTNEQGVSEGAMYDRVSGQLFRNAGTRAFVIGPDKQ